MKNHRGNIFYVTFWGLNVVEFSKRYIGFSRIEYLNNYYPLLYCDQSDVFCNNFLPSTLMVVVSNL